MAPEDRRALVVRSGEFSRVRWRSARTSIRIEHRYEQSERLDWVQGSVSNEVLDERPCVPSEDAELTTKVIGSLVVGDPH